MNTKLILKCMGIELPVNIHKLSFSDKRDYIEHMRFRFERFMRNKNNLK